MHPALKPLTAVARILLALIFVLAGIAKIENQTPTIARMTSHGILLPHFLIDGVIAVALGCGLLLMLGLAARWVALMLFFYALTLAAVFHGTVAPSACRHALSRARRYQMRQCDTTAKAGSRALAQS